MPKKTFFNLPEEKRKRIIDAALAVFSNTPYKKVTIDAIVEAADIPKGSFYQYFEHKDDLYKYLFHEINEAKSACLSEVFKKTAEKSFKEILIEAVNAGILFDMENVALHKKFMNECPQPLKNEILSIEIPKSHRLLEGVIKHYQLKGGVKTSIAPEVGAYVITACMTEIERYSGDKPLDSVVVSVIEALIDGLGT